MKTPPHNKVQTAVMVSYDPDPKRTDAQIHMIMKLQEGNTPEQVGTFLASSIAAVAYVLLETNTPELVQSLFSSLIDEASEQRKARAREFAKGSAGKVIQ